MPVAHRQRKQVLETKRDAGVRAMAQNTPLISGMDRPNLAFE